MSMHVELEPERPPVPDTPFAAGWEAAARCRERGESELAAIREVYDALPTPAHLEDVARVVGAVYADRYWGGSRMDPSLLAASLQQAGGWKPGSCARAVAAAFTRWHGLLLRASTLDSGSVPVEAIATESPDVVPVPGAPGEEVLLYPRAASVGLPLPVRDARVRMFRAPAGLNQPVDGWEPLRTEDGELAAPLRGPGGGPVPAGGGAVAARGFRLPAAAEHSTLVALASSEFFCNDPPAAAGNWRHQEWIKNNGAAGIRGIGPARGEATLRIHNQDDRPEWFAFKFYAARVPEGTEITLECDDPRLAEPVFKQDRVPSDYHPFWAKERLFPAGFAADLAVRIATPDGGPLPARASVEVRQIWLIPSDHPLYDVATRGLSHREMERRPRVLVNMGSFTFVGAPG